MLTDMKTYEHRSLGLATFLVLALGGCSAHASFGVGSSAGHGSTPMAASPQPSSSHAARHDPTNGGATTHALQQAPAETPAATTNAPTAPTPVSPAAPAEQHAHADHDRGHGNDADGVDEQNPGKANRAKQTAASNGDHDRGHGNDADRVDEDNPGKSKKKKK